MNLKKAIDLGNGYAELAEEFPDLAEFQTAWLGTYSRLVVTDTKGVYFARRINGEIIRVENPETVPLIPDLRVIIGKAENGDWQICRAMEALRP
jgi:hypothetical protein